MLIQALLYDFSSTIDVTFDNESRFFSNKDDICTCLDVKGGTVRDIDLPSQNVRASTQRPIGVCLSNHTHPVRSWNHSLCPVSQRLCRNIFNELMQHYELRLGIQGIHCILNITVATQISTIIYIIIYIIHNGMIVEYPTSFSLGQH